MKVNLRNRLSRDDVISAVILHTLSHTTGLNVEEIANSPSYSETGELDVTLTIEGHEVNFISFIEHWQSQVDQMIQEEAKEIVVTKFQDLADMAVDLSSRIAEEVNNRMEDWEEPYVVQSDTETNSGC